MKENKGRWVHLTKNLKIRLLQIILLDVSMQSGPREDLLEILHNYTDGILNELYYKVLISEITISIFFKLYLNIF